MTKFNTGNPVGSADPRDLYDDATVADNLVNGDQASYPDRTGKSRRSWQSVEDQANTQESEFNQAQATRETTFTNFLNNSGFEYLDTYAAGIEFTEYNQYVVDGGEAWFPNLNTALPYTTTGAGLPEGGSLMSRGEAVLRQETGGGIRRVDSLAGLQSISGRFDGDVAYIAGRTTAGDGGEGEFRWDGSDLSASVSSDSQQGLYVAPTSDPTGASGAWVRNHAGRLLVEMFGASSSSSAAANTAAISAALGALKDGWALDQVSENLTTDRVAKTTSTTGNKINLRLTAASNFSTSGFVQLENTEEAELSGALNCNSKEGVGVYLLNSPKCKLKKDLYIHDIANTTSIAAGVFTRDSDDCEIMCTVENVYAADSAARGVMISDQTITKNTSTISPIVKNINSDSTLNDGDGVYAEYTTVGYVGGLKVINGTYEDCRKRYIKIDSPNPVIMCNKGRSSLTTNMFELIASYDARPGFIALNEMESGDGGSEKGIGFLAVEGAIVRGNSLISKVTLPDSEVFGFSGKITGASLEIGEATGFESILTQTAASTEIDQSLEIVGGNFDTGGGLGKNGITVSGNFSHFVVKDFNCVRAVASRFLVSAPDLDDNIAEITGVTHDYSFGRIIGARELNAWDNKSYQTNGTRLMSGRKFVRRGSPPTGAASWLVGDQVELESFSVDGNNMVLIGYVCTVAGSPGTWEAMMVSTVSPAT